MYRQFLIGAFLICGWGIASSAELSSVETVESENKTCIDVGDCPTVLDTECKEICGCDKKIPTSYDNKTEGCVINIQLLILSLSEKHNTADNDIMTTEDDGMATKIRAEADRIFKGVIVAAFLFIACASVCTLTACIYCCRINYTDYQLKKSIKVLAKKMGKRSQMKKPAKVPTEPIAESCNVVVEDAGVFCV